VDTGTPAVEDYVDKMPFKFTGKLTVVRDMRYGIRDASSGMQKRDLGYGIRDAGCEL